MSVKFGKFFTIILVSGLMCFLVTACKSDSDTELADLEDTLMIEDLMGHLQSFSDIADTNSGNRAAGTAGYDASAEYLKTVMSDTNLVISEQEVSFRLFEELSDPVLETYAAGEDFITMTYSGTGDVTAEIMFVNPQFPPGPDPNSSEDGCDAADFEGIDATGKIVVLQRGSCDFQTKARNAQDSGAAAVIIFNEGQVGRTDYAGGSLGDDSDVTIPVVGLSYAAAEALYNQNQEGTIALNLAVSANDAQASAKNLIAETPGGNGDQVIMLGAHLDSAAGSPGINNNGTGAAALAELAYQISMQDYDFANKVRFAWWAGGEAGMSGSLAYTENLGQEDAAKIAMYLNADTLGSKDGVSGVGDGDLSDTADDLDSIAYDPDEMPAGSGEIEAAFASYFESEGQAAVPDVLDGETDYYPFILIGVPFGSLSAGPDNCDSSACDNVENIDQEAFLMNVQAFAHVTEAFAGSETLFAGAGKRSAGKALSGRTVSHDKSHKNRHLRPVR
ncbi:M28 family peptidase [Desulfococcaceae bacterium HSG8]|nr:M28 family peptidase [Desulfococcaceae bacterium HSG8]